VLLIIIFLKHHPPQESAIDTGLKGTKYKDRILGSQSPHYKKSFEANQLIGGDVLKKQLCMF
jgi:L-serine dehydratase